MIVWPQIVCRSQHAEAEPVEPPRREPAPGSTHAPSVDLDLSEPAEDCGPALSTLLEPAAPHRVRLYSAGLVLALCLSALIHTGVLAFLLEHLSRPGAEPATDAISVEIVLEEPPSPTAGAEAANSQRQAASAWQSEGTPDETPLLQEAQDAPSVPERSSPKETLEADAEPPPTINETPARPEREHSPQQSSPEEKRTLEPAAVASVVLPTENIPVPAPRPTQQKAKPAPPARAQTRDQQRPVATRKQTATAQEPATAARKPASRSSAGSDGGRSGGATAGELQAYTARLIRHIGRYKRYPQSAQRQGLSGRVGIAITLSPDGGFMGARISQSSGYSVFDQEALAATRRAIPYPRPPQGYKGGRVTVSLRFERGR